MSRQTNNDHITAPSVSSFTTSRPLRSVATKRDSFAAELERDPQFSTAKRQQRTHAFTSSMAHASLERQLAAIQTTKMELEAKLRERDATIESLEHDRRLLAQREKEERQEKEREQAERQEEKKQRDAEIRELRASLLKIEQEHNDLDETHGSLYRSTRHTINSQQSELATLSRQTAFLESELTESRRVADQKDRKILEMEERIDELSSKQVDAPLMNNAEDGDWKVVRTELSRQAGYLRTLEAANSKMTSELSILRQRHESLEVLREQKRDLERKLSATDALRQTVITLEAEVEAARREREEWASRTDETNVPSKTPASVTRSLSALRLEYGRLMEEHGVFKAHLREKEHELSGANGRIDEYQRSTEDLETRLRASEEKIGRSERRVILAERESSFLQAMMASFSAEEPNLSSAAIDQVKEQRIRELEGLLEDYKLNSRLLEQEVDALGGHSAAVGRGKTREQLYAELNQSITKATEIEAALKEVETANEKHIEKIEELEQKLYDLSGEIGAGRHIPPGIRVLTFKDNPAQQEVDLRQAALARLKSENEALLERLASLESGGARPALDSSSSKGDGFVPRESWDVLKTEKEELQAAVEHKDKRIRRLQEIYAKKSGEFREVIASILGFKLAFSTNGTVRMTSIYDLNAVFVFKPSANSDASSIQLVGQGDGGPDELPQMMRHWLEEVQCMPGFMASVTLGCIDKTGGRVEA